MKLFLFAVTGLLAALLPGAAQSQTAGIEWRVQDRFRLFGEAGAARAEVEAVMSEIQAQAGAGFRLSSLYPRLRGLLSGPAAQALRASNWDAQNRHYRSGYLYPQSYRISATFTGAAAGQPCRWTVDGQPQPGDACQTSLDVPAARTARGWGAEADVAVTQSDGLNAQTHVSLRDRLVVALGDSFIAGEGNPDVPADLRRLQPGKRFALPEWPRSLDPAHDPITTAQWWDEPCHRTLLSWPVLASLRDAAVAPHDAVTLVHLACSGATIDQGLLGPEPGVPGCPKENPPQRHCPGDRANPPQLSQLRTLLHDSPTPRPIDRLLLSIGGNDVGFAGVIAYELVPRSGSVLAEKAASLLALAAGAVCPFDNTDGSLGGYCWMRRWFPSTQSASARLTGLPLSYQRLRDALSDLQIAPNGVLHTFYPEILSADHTQELCHHALNHKEIDALPVAQQATEQAYVAANRLRIHPWGFEAMESLTPWPLPNAIAAMLGDFTFTSPAGQMCDVAHADWRSPEVCQAQAILHRLNRVIDASDRQWGWQTISTHLGEIRGHGWCMADDNHPLALPVAVFDGTRWQWQNTPGITTYDPYDESRPRWFRTTNDSLMTQYGGPGRIIHGTAHPTFRAHVAYADAVPPLEQ